MSLRRTQENLRITCPSCEQKLDASAVPAFEAISCPECSCGFTVPFRFGQYLLTEAIEEGEFSGIYRAQDLKLRREVAVKVLFESLAGDSRIVELFLGAARRTAILNHVNILPIYSCDCYDGLPYIVMEYMAGTCLYRGLSSLDHKLSVEDCIHYCDMAARGLDAAHREDVNHGGLRPTNVLWDEAGNIKISDFGMYEFKCACAEKMGLDWRVFFHCGYTSPEVLQGESQGGLAADIFGLGTTLYHVLVGQRPFSNTVESRMESLQTPPPTPRQMRPDVPENVSDYVMHMIAFDPHARPHTYREIISTFFKLKEGLGQVPEAGKTVGEQPPKSKHHSSIPVSKRTRRRVNLAATRSKRRKKRNLLPWLAFLILMTLGLGAGSLIFLAHNGHPGAKKILAAVTGKATGERQSNGQKKVVKRVPQADLGDDDDATDYQVSGVRVPPAFFFRPVPPGLNFSRGNAPMQRYLDGLPSRLKRQELSRLSVLEGVRPHLLQMMGALPYKGEGLQLRDGRVLACVVSACDSQGLTVQNISGETRQIGWEQVSVYQYMAFLKYYVDRRLERETLDAEEQTALARDYLMLALICDWLNDTSRAVKFATDAIKADPKTGVKTRELLPYLPL